MDLAGPSKLANRNEKAKGFEEKFLKIALADFWNIFKIFSSFTLTIKKIMFEKKSDGKTVLFFTFEISMVHHVSSHHDFGKSFELNDYFSSITTK
jgi:hypothetical protein